MKLINFTIICIFSIITNNIFAQEYKLYNYKNDQASILYKSAESKLKNKEYWNALTDINKSIELYSNNFGSYSCKGFIHWSLGHYDEAITSFKKCMEVALIDTMLKNNFAREGIISLVNSSCNYSIGSINCEKKDYWIALIYFEKVIEKDKEASFYVGYGEAKLGLNDFHSSILELSKALNLNPNYTRALTLRGFAYLGLDDNYNSCNDFRKAINLGEQDPAVLKLFYSNCK